METAVRGLEVASRKANSTWLMTYVAKTYQIGLYMLC